jgi:hypothetical protein
MFKLKHVAFAFVIAHREILGSPGKALRKCILQHAWCHTWEVLVDGVAGNMSHFQSIFLPLRIESQQLARVIEV